MYSSNCSTRCGALNRANLGANVIINLICVFFCHYNYFVYFCSGVVTIGNKNVKLIITGYGV